MLKNRKLERPKYPYGGTQEKVYGYCQFEGYHDTLSAPIEKENIIKEIDNEEYYFAEVDTSIIDTDYHSYYVEQEFKGVFLAFNLPTLNTEKYFGYNFNEELLNPSELIEIIKNILKANHLLEKYKKDNIIIANSTIQITLEDKTLDEKVLNCCQDILNSIRNYYQEKGIHITRMFGSYILLKNEGDHLKSIAATPIPIKYCPLMIKLLKEVGGPTAENLIKSLESTNEKAQTQLMCELIDKVVIAGGYFDTNRPLNSCEANVLFGASETMSSAFQSNLIDAAVIVSNNLGTIITTNAPSTQGAVKRMTGLFYTSPDSNLLETAKKEGIIPVFPYTAEIDQLEGVKKAIALGYKNIAVSVAASDNYLHKEISSLEEKYNVTIYKFGLCSTGITKETAEIMSHYADIIWSCASAAVKEIIEPNAIAQVGVKIPVHIMTKKGWLLIKNHLNLLSGFDKIIPLEKGEEKRVILHDNDEIKVLSKKNLHQCSDCPHPCI